ncbi:MATE family efflux transporter [Chloroflexota bacterium]
MKNLKSPHDRNPHFERDWTEGSIIRNLLSLSWPLIITNSLTMLGPTIDMVWVGKLGSASIAGVGVAGMAVMMIDSARMGLNMGTRALIARAIGADDIQEANLVAQQAFVISGAFSIFLAIIGIFLSEIILGLFGLEQDVIAEGAVYMRIMFIGAVAMSFRFMADGIMQSSGDTVSPMKIAVFFRLFHVVLCPFLVFGWWIFPRMGVSGAAITNVISQSTGLVIAMWVLFTGRSRLKPTLRNFRLDLGTIWRIVKVGIPSSVMAMGRNFGHLLLMRLVAPFGTLAVAGHTLVQRIEMIIFMPSFAVGMSSGVLAGQNLGAMKPERAEKGSWIALGLVEVLMTIFALIIFFWAEEVTRVFNSEPEVVKTTASFLRIAYIGFFALAFEAVIGMSISGSGDTLPPMLVTILVIWIVQLPLSYFLPLVNDLGIYGIRWAIVIGLAVGAIVYGLYFKLGRWKQKKI